MKRRRLVQRAVFVPVLAVVLAVFTVGQASAQPVTDGSVDFSGDPGDWITGGGSYKYSKAAGDDLTVQTNANRTFLSVGVNGANGDWWTISLAAPKDDVLSAKTYENAHRYPFQGAGPGLSLSGNGRGCNELTGSFTIREISWGPQGYLHKLDASFEQHCEGGSAAARGNIFINNQPPPPELKLETTIAAEGKANTVNGKALVNGTISCTTNAAVQMTGTVTQVKNNVIIRGNFSASVECKAGAPVAWNAAADPTGTTPFQRGKAEVFTRSTAQDPNYPGQAISEKTAIVELKRYTPAA
ncbi:hypothetical protein [Lentzea flava]|uniref:hypothetical protein n=1 Tax=Lentzea flava TaxID=103732 RepID=UPI0016701BF9|nr:hypothetical protein [Lentzea flava]MCP2196745.1 hypothetical protein [Lentzea flava]